MSARSYVSSTLLALTLSLAAVAISWLYEQQKRIDLRIDNINRTLVSRFDSIEQYLDEMAIPQAAANVLAEVSVPDRESAPLTAGYSEEADDRVLVRVPDDGSTNAPLPNDMPALLVVNPTVAQNEYYLMMKARLNDPQYVETLNLARLVNEPEFASLPAPMRDRLISRAVEKFNRGEVSRQVFLRDAPVTE